MPNSEFNINAPANSGIALSTYHKQHPVAAKKVALRDVQNDNRSIMYNYQENLSFREGRHVTDAIKVFGTKIPTLECPSSPPCHPPSRNNISNEHLVRTGRKSESPSTKGLHDIMEKHAEPPQSRHFYHMEQEIPSRLSHMRENHVHGVPVAKSNNRSTRMTSSYSGQSVPNPFGKPCNMLPGTDINRLNIDSEVPHVVYTMGSNDQHWKERFIHLQNVLKQCEESSQTEYIQMLLQLSPVELSRHAVELEKRSIQLTIEEGKEMQRLKASNILTRPVPNGESTQQLDFKK